ncbi:ABC transporter ATP-binding protein [Phaeobacter gallaeciensis]|uniref:ABC transporter ATP-binding protein n=1 Tax=Phaeobacter gallaeciensis TaxID=60890 RepID=UPI000BBBBFF6|nr:ABC transporter ATP-binding protein [Phaeobacter gallaeciensis]ATF20651.1 carbohydrate ABC transporter ATP-binding protein, CUT1 family [Phaeobacter gallaeciensis]ATF24760.1 carbohydrate ABC transporter ATP-binding protein, CUT1 family [Phaeobacter gallaeciensis]
MNALEIRNLSKRFGKTTALDDVSLIVPKGDLVVLLGPTGAGKTTLQRLVAGLETPDTGQILINGEEVTGLQPNQRPVSMVFESLALYPNLTAYENIAHPMRIQGLAAQDIDAKVTGLADILRVSHILDRKPASFSGGEKQRIAIGRTLAKPAGIYLLDEPLSSLDAVLRSQLRSELKRLLSATGHSIIFATPDYTEALALGDNVNVMMNGRIVQSGSANELYSKPTTTEIAQFVGNPPINLVPGQILPAPGGGIETDLAGLRLGLPKITAASCDGTVLMGIRPEDIRVHKAESAEPGTQTARVIDMEPLGNRTTLILDINGTQLTASVETEENLDALRTVTINLEPSRLHLFSNAGRRLS